MKLEFLEPDTFREKDAQASGQVIAHNSSPADKSPKERRHAEFFDVINASLKIESPEQFCQWVQGELQYVLPHTMMACGFGLFGGNQASIEQIITSNLPAGYLDDLTQAGGLKSSPVVNQWAQTRRPVIFEPDTGKDNTPWMSIFRKYGLRNIAAHGQCDLNSHTTSYFSFFNIPVALTSKHGQLLEMLIPHLHVALTKALGKSRHTLSDSAAEAEILLTRRETEILRWMASGKTNGEIGKELHISDNTVKNHVQRILEKLQVTSRTEAVAIGLKKSIFK